MTTPNELRAMVNKAMGSDVLHVGSDERFKVTYIPTNVLPVDVLLNGGIPRGRFTEIFGDFSTLKSYIGLKTIAGVQQSGGIAALIDTEHAFDPEWATAIGVSVDDLILAQPETGEAGVDASEGLIRGNVDIIVFDSIAAALPQDEQTKRLHKENIQPARLAALMSAACRRLTAANSRTAMLWINQTRLNVGQTFGTPESNPGGRAMPYYASYRIRLKKVGKITKDSKVYDGQAWRNTKEQTGQKFQAALEKSKLSAPFRDVWFDWDLESGQVDEIGFLIAQGLEKGYVILNGNTWQHGRWKAVGRERFKTLVTSTPEAQKSLRGALTGFSGASNGKRVFRKRK